MKKTKYPVEVTWKELVIKYTIGAIVIVIIYFGMAIAQKHGYLLPAETSNTTEVHKYPMGTPMGLWLNWNEEHNQNN